MLRFNILGSVEAIHEEHICRPTAPKVRSVLALLLARSNYLVEIDSIIEELWGTEPPRSSVTTAQTYIYHLRQRMMAARVVEDAESVIVTSAPGYVLRIDEDQIDAVRFQKLSEQGRQLLPELRTLVSAYPLNEWLHARLIEALHRSGRRGEALLAFQSVRKILDEELGLEPSAELRQLQQDVLMGEMPVAARRSVIQLAS